MCTIWLDYRRMYKNSVKTHNHWSKTRPVKTKDICHVKLSDWCACCLAYRSIRHLLSRWYKLLRSYMMSTYSSVGLSITIRQLHSAALKPTLYTNANNCGITGNGQSLKRCWSALRSRMFPSLGSRSPQCIWFLHTVTQIVSLHSAKVHMRFIRENNMHRLFLGLACRFVLLQQFTARL